MKEYMSFNYHSISFLLTQKDKIYFLHAHVATEWSIFVLLQHFVYWNSKQAFGLTDVYSGRNVIKQDICDEHLLIIYQCFTKNAREYLLKQAWNWCYSCYRFKRSNIDSIRIGKTGHSFDKSNLKARGFPVMKTYRTETHQTWNSNISVCFLANLATSSLIAFTKAVVERLGTGLTEASFSIMLW